MADITTPAATAPLWLTPSTMKTVNRKLPMKASRNTSRRTRGVGGGSAAGRRSQCSMPAPPIPKRSQPSRNTGNTAASGLLRATQAPTTNMLAARLP
ncbi:hypothetical protein CDEN61S_00461 [Castellaniella denitrificans]